MYKCMSTFWKGTFGWRRVYTVQYTIYNIHILKVFSCCPSTVYVHTVSLVYTTYCLWTFGGGFVGWVDFRFVCRV